MEIEYGSSQPVRFAKAVMRDGDGNVMLCQCGKPAGSGCMGKESYIVWCSDCTPYKDMPVAEFIYRPPNGT